MERVKDDKEVGLSNWDNLPMWDEQSIKDAMWDEESIKAAMWDEQDVKEALEKWEKMKG